MDLLAAALLGVVQGLTEFLPISSSAHLILARAFTGWDPERFGIAFDVALHVGTLAAVLVFFRAELIAMARTLPRASGPDGRRLRLIVIGTLPIVAVGGLWTESVEAATRTPGVAASMLVAGAGLLLVVERLGRGRGGDDRLGAGGALAIGAAQAAALVPGVSRSGATIAAGMALGLTREAAARFAFLLGVPAIIAAAAKKAFDMRDVAWAPGDVQVFVVGMVSSAVVGYLTVKYLIRFLATHRLDVFAWYRIVLALAAFGWLAAR